MGFRVGFQMQTDKATFEEAQSAALTRLQAEQETLITEIAEVSMMACSFTMWT